MPFQRVTNAALGTLAAVVALLAVVSVALVSWIGYDDGAEKAGSEASRAATTAAQRFFSYDYRHIDADIAAAKKLVTGSLAGDYDQTSTKVVKPAAATSKAVVAASVSATSVISAEPDKAEILLYLNQSTRNTKIKGTRLDQSRVQLTMTKVGEQWLISAARSL